MTARNIFAYTAAGTMPEYLSVNVNSNGEVTFTSRSPDHFLDVTKLGCVKLPHAELVKLHAALGEFLSR